MTTLAARRTITLERTRRLPKKPKQRPLCELWFDIAYLVVALHDMAFDMYHHVATPLDSALNGLLIVGLVYDLCTHYNWWRWSRVFNQSRPYQVPGVFQMLFAKNMQKFMLIVAVVGQSWSYFKLIHGMPLN